MASLFREKFEDSITQRLSAEDIPFYDRSPCIEESILSFLKSPPPNSKAKIMTLFEPTGTGKTTIINNIPKLFPNIYQVIIHPSIFGYIGCSDVRWRQFFGSVENYLSEFSQDNKTIIVTTANGPEIPFLTLSNSVKEVLGKDSLLFLHLDECQLVMGRSFFKVLYSLSPCSHNVKMILTGTTALGNDEIKGTSQFQSIACPPLQPFTAERVKKVLNNVLKWQELEVQNQTIEQSEEIKKKIEEELEGTPKNILYFLQELGKQSNPITKQMLQDTLNSAYYVYKTKQKKMLEELLNIGKQLFENEAQLFEKLVMIFSFPNAFGLEKDGNGVLTGSISNQVIQYLLPFNHSGLVRINHESMDMIRLAIPDNFTLRYIREKTLYFPKEWLLTFNNSCNVAHKVANAVKGYSVQIWLAIMLLNQHSTLSAHVQRVIKERKKFSSIIIDSDKKNYSTFEGQPEDIDVTEPMMAKDGGDNSCVDAIIPFSALDSDNQWVKFKLVVQITCQKDPALKAKSFFDRILNYANSKSNEKKRAFYSPCIALFLTVFPLSLNGKTITSVNKQLEQNSDLLLLQLDKSPELFPGLKLLEMTENVTLLQEWVKSSNTFLNIDSGNNNYPEREVVELSDKNISPYGSSKRQKMTLHLEPKTELKLSRSQGLIHLPVNVTIDKSKPKSWKSDQITSLLTDTENGIGLSQKRAQGVDIEGSDFENIVDSLIRFKGDKEAKIEHATNELPDRMDKTIKKSITRWVFNNLITSNQ